MPLSIAPRRHQATLAGSALELSPREFRLLLELAREPGAVVAKGVLAQRLEPLGEPLDFAAVEGHVSNLRRKIGGVSEKMLSQTLQSLEQDGFIERKALPVVPPHVEYTLTPMGEEVALLVDGLTTWIERNLPRIMQTREARAVQTADVS